MEQNKDKKCLTFQLKDINLSCNKFNMNQDEISWEFFLTTYWLQNSLESASR